MKYRLHLACGTIFLKGGWCNIDLNLPNHYLAKDREDLVRQNGTTLNHYYKQNVTKEDFMQKRFQKREVVCDIFANIKNLPFENDTVDEMLGVQIFEHFAFPEGEVLLDYWRDLLKVGGSLRLHVPDIEGIIELYNEEKDIDWSIRQLYGSQKDEFGIHKAGYTKYSLEQLMRKHHFRNTKILPNINNYPAFGIIGYK